MKAQRPDQAKFDTFAAIFNRIDGELESFCNLNNYKLDKNLHRQPCRVLRKGTNPEYIIEVFLDVNWFTIEFSENLPYSMGCCAYYTPPDNSKYIWKLDSRLLENVTFPVVQQKLPEKLPVALKTMIRWTPSVILSEGEKRENLRNRYEYPQ